MRTPLPKSIRLRKRRQFLHTALHGNTATGKYLRVQYIYEGNSPPRLGITATKRYGNAVIRNTFKRQIRESYRLIAPKLDKGWDFVVKPRKFALRATFHEISHELSNLLSVIQATSDLGESRHRSGSAARDKDSKLAYQVTHKN